MCGRFTLLPDPEKLAEQFGLELPPVLVPRYNIAPTQPVGIVRVDPQTHDTAVGAGAVATSSRRGPIDPSIGARMINTRLVGAGEAAFPRRSERRRCLIPASGFFEWRKPGSGKQP